MSVDDEGTIKSVDNVSTQEDSDEVGFLRNLYEKLCGPQTSQVEPPYINDTDSKCESLPSLPKLPKKRNRRVPAPTTPQQETAGQQTVPIIETSKAIPVNDGTKANANSETTFNTAVPTEPLNTQANNDNSKETTTAKPEALNTQTNNDNSTETIPAKTEALNTNAKNTIVQVVTITQEGTPQKGGKLNNSAGQEANGKKGEKKKQKKKPVKPKTKSKPKSRPKPNHQWLLKLNFFYLINQIQILAILVPMGFPSAWNVVFGSLSDVVLLDLTSLLLMNNPQVPVSYVGNETNATDVPLGNTTDALNKTNALMNTTDALMNATDALSVNNPEYAVGLNLACALIVVVVVIFVIHQVHTLIFVSFENNNLIWQSFRFVLAGSFVVSTVACFLFVPSTIGVIVFGTILLLYPCYALAAQVYMWYVEWREKKSKNNKLDEAFRSAALAIRTKEFMVMQFLIIFVFPAILRRALAFFTEEFTDGLQSLRGGIAIAFVIIQVLVIAITIWLDMPIEEDSEVGVTNAYLTGVFLGTSRYYIFYLLFEKAVLIIIVAFLTSKAILSLVVLVILLFMLLFTTFNHNLWKVQTEEPKKCSDGLETARLDIVGRVSIIVMVLFAMLYDSLLPAETAVIGFVDFVCFAITFVWIGYAVWTFWNLDWHPKPEPEVLSI